MTVRMSYPPVLFSREDAAAYLGVSPRKLDEYQALSRIVPRDLDGMKRFHREDLDAFASRLSDWETTPRKTA